MFEHGCMGGGEKVASTCVGEGGEGHRVVGENLG